jgi:hypothetical protein
MKKGSPDARSTTLPWNIRVKERVPGLYLSSPSRVTTATTTSVASNASLDLAAKWEIRRKRASGPNLARQPSDVVEIEKRSPAPGGERLRIFEGKGGGGDDAVDLPAGGNQIVDLVGQRIVGEADEVHRIRSHHVVVRIRKVIDRGQDGPEQAER